MTVVVGGGAGVCRAAAGCGRCLPLRVHEVTQFNFFLQWNSLEYHKKSLANLMEAMKRTRRWIRMGYLFLRKRGVGDR